MMSSAPPLYSNVCKYISNFMLVFILLIIYPHIAAAQTYNTYYIANQSCNDSWDGSYENPWCTFEHAFSVMKGGDTLIIKNGTYYQSIYNPPSGTPQQYTTIKAEYDGKVIIDGEFQRTAVSIESKSFIQIEGLKCIRGDTSVVHIGGTDSIPSTFIKIKRVGALSSNRLHGYMFSIGQGANNILLEDCWAAGLGKSGIHIFGYYSGSAPTYNITVRRCVVRIDAGDAVNAFQVYGAKDVLFENCIAIDLSQNVTDSMAAFRCRADASGVKYYGCIALNLGDKFDGFSTEGYNHEHHNCVAWNNEISSRAGRRTGNAGGVHILSQCTFKGFNYGCHDPNGVIEADHCLFLSNNNHGAGGSYNWYYDPPVGQGTNYITSNPKLKYITQTTSNLTTENKKRGATIEKIYENGILTNQSLWPFPNEDRIKKDFSSIILPNGYTTNASRGFCANGTGLYGGPITLTSYIWEYLGNPCPPEICNYRNGNGWTITLSFEKGISGDIAEGESAFDDAGSKTFFSSDNVHTGSMAAKMEWKEGESGFSSCMGEVSFPKELHEGDEIWIRGYYYFSSPWSWNCSPRVKILRVRVKNESGKHIGYLSVLASKGGVITLSNEVDGYEPKLEERFDEDRWQSIEMYIKFSSVNPVFRIWKDGVLIAEDKTHKTLKNSSDSADFSLVMSYWNGGAPQNQTEFIDDFVYTTYTPTNRDAHGNPMIGPLNWTISHCASDADNNPCDGKISLSEIVFFIKKWKNKEISISEVFETIKEWKKQTI